MRKAITLMAVALTIVSFSCKKDVPEGPKRYEVTADLLRVREKPDTSAGVVTGLNRHTLVELIEVTEKVDEINGVKAPWFRIKAPDGNTGFAFSGFLKEVPPPSAESAPGELMRTWTLYQDCPNNAITFRQNGTCEWVECFSDEKGEEVVNKWNGTYNFISESEIRVFNNRGQVEHYSLENRDGKRVLIQGNFVFHPVSR